MKIGVFDSGVGGLSVAQAIEASLPEAEVMLREDRKNLPYGSKKPAELLSLVSPIISEMIADGCQVIVIACNTVSTTIIEALRDQSTVPLIAMEPMVRPAAERTKSGIIAVCATPSTLASERYNWLKETYASNIKVLEPDCSDWASMIEESDINGNKITERIKAVLDVGADVIVLGCTHYHWIEQEIRDLCAARAEVLQPEQPVIAQLRRVLARLP